MLNASIDRNDTVSFNDTEKDDTDNTRDYAKDKDENGLYDAIDKYPDFIDRVFDTDNLQPIRRSAGIAIVAGIPVLLQFLVFEPGRTSATTSRTTKSWATRALRSSRTLVTGTQSRSRAP